MCSISLGMPSVVSLVLAAPSPKITDGRENPPKQEGESYQNFARSAA